MYDLIIVGGGPAGTAAAVYAGRKQLKTLLITESFGGQSMVSDKIENWIGETAISGMELAKRLEAHVRAQESVEIKMPARVVGVEKLESGGWHVKTDQAGAYKAKALLVVSGGRRRKLGVPGEKEFEGRGVAYCSTCDAPLFRGKTVALVGAGNAGAEGVVDLLPYAQKIFWLVRSEITADPATVEKIKAHRDLVEIIRGVEVVEILGDKVVRGVRIKKTEDRKQKADTQKQKTDNWEEGNSLDVDGLFIEIGSVPNSEFMKGLVKMNARGEIIVDHKTGATSAPGIFAAGDVTDEPYKQNNISVGNAVAATLSAYSYLHGRFLAPASL